MTSHTALILFLALLVGGAIAAQATILHTFAVAIDVFVENLGYNRVGCVTLSSRAGLAARQGDARWERLIELLFGHGHCEQAIAVDAARNIDSLKVLYRDNKAALGLLKMLEVQAP